ncbi:MAG: hypothetical protein LBU53_02135 [Zoogloeaceae bacterium]|jgi:hypothetical protein|nr:hypothetical protein [Zoogloeaceae bacterium]
MSNKIDLSAFSVKQLKEFQNEIKNRIAGYSKFSKKNIKLEHRRKIIIGGWILKNAPEIVTQILPVLEREQDKIAFQNWNKKGE